MPGLFGYFLKDASAAAHGAELLSGMGRRLTHLPFYRVNSADDGRTGIARVDLDDRTRLPILRNRDRGLIFAIYGEIYWCGDQACQAVSDPQELALALYEKEGVGFPAKLNGDFHGALWDPGRGKLLLFSDRFGYRHLYVYEDENVVLFAPEAKAFLAYGSLDRSLDEQGVADFFNFGYQMGDRTLLARVNLLPPASIFEFTPVKKGVVRYWQPRYTKSRGVADIDDCVDIGHQLFVQSMERKVRGSKRVLIPLSGGLDSRLITATAKDLGCDITSATIGIRNSREHVIASRVCLAAGLPPPRLVEVKPFWIHAYGERTAHLNEANHSALGLVAQHVFHETMGRDYDCLLSGIFGGHLSFGSAYFTSADLSTNYTAEERRVRLARGFNGDRFATCMGGCATARLKGLAERYLTRTLDEEWDRTEGAAEEYALRQDACFLHNRIRRAMNVIDQNRFYLRDQLPFAGYELFDFYLSLSTELLLGHRLYREIYKRKLPRLAAVPWWSTGVDLYSPPQRIQPKIESLKRKLLWKITRLSAGRVNILNTADGSVLDPHYRMDRGNREWIEGILLSDRCLQRGFFDRDGVRALLDKQRRGGSYFHEISKMVTFELWARSFVDH